MRYKARQELAKGAAAFLRTCYHGQRCDAGESWDVYVHALQVGRKLHDRIHPLPKSTDAL